MDQQYSCKGLKNSDSSQMKKKLAPYIKKRKESAKSRLKLILPDSYLKDGNHARCEPTHDTPSQNHSALIKNYKNSFFGLLWWLVKFFLYPIRQVIRYKKYKYSEQQN